MTLDFHPDLRRIARFSPRDVGLPRTLRLQRALIGFSCLRSSPGVTVIPLAAGASLRLHRPPNQRGAVAALLWIHGGGYVFGRAQIDDELCRKFSTALGITVAAVDYRLAPEHPYPAPVDDCAAAFEWLVAQPDIDSARIAIGGASAGGGLAAALAFRIRDEGRISPVLQLLSYPMLDDRVMPPGKDQQRRFRWWGLRSNSFGWTAYLGDADRDMAVPGRREDLAGVAPAWIGVGTFDLFADVDTDYAKRLTHAGVPCHLEVLPGVFHGFDAVAPKAAVSRRFFARQCIALRRAFGGRP